MTNFQIKIGYTFKDQNLLLQAFTHKSYHNEIGAELSCGHNERLEFLGDAVLDLALSDILMRTFVQLAEGDLSKLRASLVNETVLAELAQEYGTQEIIRLGRGELNSGGAAKPRLLGSAFEAFLGAFYLDAGFDKTREFIEKLFASRLASLDLQNFFKADYKTRLQEWVQEKHKQVPEYVIISESGPDHSKIFEVEVRVLGQAWARGQGKSKKQAEQEAARAALESKHEL